MGDDLQATLWELLREQPEGFREFELLATLEERGQPGFRSGGQDGPVGLYCRHFRLFHALYGLRDRLREEAAADLQVHCLGIRLLGYHNPGARLPSERDPLREYYRDLGRLDTLSEEEVRGLIEGGLERVFAVELRTRALDALGLTDPVSDADIRRRFHRLALEHHPDRGGDLQRFQEISAAAASLR